MIPMISISEENLQRNNYDRVRHALIHYFLLTKNILWFRQKLPRRIKAGIVLAYFVLYACYACALPVSAKDLNAQPVVKPELSYDFSFDPGPPARLRVESRFNGGSAGFTVLGLCVNKWLGLSDCTALIRGLNVRSVSNGKSLSVTEPEPNIWVVDHAPGEMIVVSYDLALESRDEMPSPYKARLEPDSVIFFGNAALLIPEHLIGKVPISIQYQWGVLPQNWKAISSYGQGAEPHSLSLRPKAFIDSLFSIGRSTNAEPGNAAQAAPQVLWLLSPPAPKAQEELAKALDSARGAVKDYLQASAGEGHIWFIVPTPGSHVRAVTLTNSFVLFFTPHVGPQASAETRVAHLISMAHELVHSTYAGRISVTGGPVPENFFLEGMAEFIARRALYRSGVIDEHGWAAAVSDKLTRYRSYPSAQPGVPIKVASELTSDLIVMLMDSEIRTSSRGKKDIADFAHALMERGDKDGDSTSIAWPKFLAALSEFTSVGVAESIANISKGNAGIELPVNIFADCAHIDSSKSQPRIQVTGTANVCKHVF